MQRSTKLVLTFVGVSSLMMLGVILFSVMVIGRAGTTRVPDNAWLVLGLAGDLPDIAPEEPFPFPGLNSPPLTLVDVRYALGKAKEDRRVRGVLLNLSNFSAGWAVTQELREVIEDFRDSGKQVITYMESGADKDYYLALATDKIYLAPEGTLFLNGLSLEAQFYKDTLDKVGVEAEFYHVGEYKSAPDSYTRNTMSDSHREVLNAIAESLYQQLLKAMASGRKITLEEAQAFIDDFSLAGPKLVESRIIDGLQYEDDVLKELNAGEDPETLSVSDYLKSLQDPLVQGESLAVLYVSGEIRSGESSPGGLASSTSVGSDTIKEAMKDLEDDEDVKGLLVRIDSPGGSALAADVIWHSIMAYKARTQKPVVVSMSNLAASGGYWIATAGDEIVAHPGTLTGSIGVFFGKFSLKGLFEKVGANVEVVSRGRYADMFNPIRHFNEAEAIKVNQWLRTTYDTFLDRVSKARGMTPADVDAVAQGRVWTGEQALDKKLVDALGGFDESLKRLKAKANITPEQKVSLSFYPQSDNVLQRLARQLTVESSPMLPAQAKNLLRTFAQAEQDARSEEPAPMALIPFTLELR